MMVYAVIESDDDSARILYAGPEAGRNQFILLRGHKSRNKTLEMMGLEQDSPLHPSPFSYERAAFFYMLDARGLEAWGTRGVHLAEGELDGADL